VKLPAQTLSLLGAMRNVNYFLILAIVLVVLWVVASITRWVVGAMLNLLLVFAVIFLVLWIVRRVR
jgi:hypothetical protein